MEEDETPCHILSEYLVLMKKGQRFFGELGKIAQASTDVIGKFIENTGLMG